MSKLDDIRKYFGLPLTVHHERAAILDFIAQEGQLRIEAGEHEVVEALTALYHDIARGEHWATARNHALATPALHEDVAAAAAGD